MKSNYELTSELLIIRDTRRQRIRRNKTMKTILILIILGIFAFLIYANEPETDYSLWLDHMEQTH